MQGGWGGEWGRGRGCDVFKMAAGTVESLVGGREGGSSLDRLLCGLILCNLAERGLRGMTRPHTQTRVVYTFPIIRREKVTALMLSAPYPWRIAVEAPVRIIPMSGGSVLGMMVKFVYKFNSSACYHKCLVLGCSSDHGLKHHTFHLYHTYKWSDGLIYVLELYKSIIIKWELSND